MSNSQQDTAKPRRSLQEEGPSTNRARKLAEFVRALLVLAVLGWSLYRSLGWVVAQITAIQSDALKTLVAATLTAGGGLAGVLYQKHAERKKDIELKLREEKVKTYGAFLDLVFDFMKSARVRGELELQHDFQQRFMDVARLLVMWGSDELVRKYGRWRLFVAKAPNPTLEEQLASFGDLLLQVRKDMGHRDRSLSHVDILSLFINDADAFLAQSPERKRVSSNS